MTINYITMTIEMTKAESKAAGKVGTEAFKEMLSLMQQFPNYKIQVNNNADPKLSEGQVQKLQAIFANKNILEKEQQLDKFKWDYITEMNEYGTFNMDVILAFLAKGKLIDRWNKLDKETGEQMFRKLVDEVRGTFKGVEKI